MAGKRRHPRARRRGWWGSGPPPTETWPGVTIAIDRCGGRYRFDAARADRVCDFFPRFCSHSKGEFAGQPFHPLPYQTQLILRPLFGWVDAAGLRRFRKAFIEIPKKNGKTQLLAGLALYMLLCDNEPGAEIYIAASDREQARILFNAAKAMIDAHPALQARLIVFRNQIMRKDDPTAFFHVLSADAATKHGPNIHCLIIDELHAQPDRELFETLTRGTIARRQPLILLITTAGSDDESICAEEYDYAKRVLSGAVTDERHLPVIFEAGVNEDCYDPAVITRVNPGIGVTVALEAVTALAREAQAEPRKRNDYLRYHCNRWTNQATAWIPVEWWDACRQPFTDAEVRDLPCAAGLDLAQKYDLACLNVVFRRYLDTAITVEVQQQKEDGTTAPAPVTLNYCLYTVPFFWIPENTLAQHERDDKVPYTLWRQAGLLTATDGDVIDYGRIYTDITSKIIPRFPRLKSGVIGYDPAFATDLATKLRDLAGLPVVEILQGYKMLSEPAQIVEALIKGRRLLHDGHKVLRWCWENVAIKTDDSGRIRPVKPKRSSKRIDGAVALIMGEKALSIVPRPPEFQLVIVGGR